MDTICANLGLSPTDMESKRRSLERRATSSTPDSRVRQTANGTRAVVRMERAAQKVEPLSPLRRTGSAAGSGHGSRSHRSSKDS